MLQPDNGNLGGIKIFFVGQKAQNGAGLALGHGADFFEFGGFFAVLETHLVHQTVPAHTDFDVVRQRVNHGHTDTVQTAGEVVVLVGEFAAGMQPGQDQFYAGDFFFRVNVDRHAAAVVFHFHGAVFVHGQGDGFGVSGQGFVDTVVQYFLHQVIGSAGVGVHARTLAHRIKTGEDFNGV